jgi:hypothetical protein
MGTIHDWIEVVIWGAVFGGATALRFGPRQAPDGSKTGWSWADGVYWAAAGLSYGITITFRGQAFRPPPLILMLVLLASGIAANKLAPLKPPRIDKSPPIDKSPYRQ